jgi:hypothetical protein
MRFKILIISILSFSILLIGEEKRIAFSLKGGLYSPSSTTYNEEVVPPVNNAFTEFNAWLSSAGLKANMNELDEIKGGMTFGGEVEFFVTSKFSFAFGAEYWKKTPEAFVEASGTVSGDSYDISDKYKIDFSLIPIFTTLRVSLPSERFRAYLGAGIGYYMGKVVLREEWDWKENGISFEKGSHEVESSGKAIIPHINGGFDFDILKNISICADLRYPFGKIKSFKIEKDTSDPTVIGENLKYEDVNGEEKDFKWELNGFNFGLSLKFKF